jgi:Dyp-type peroxidase family
MEVRYSGLDPDIDEHGSLLSSLQAGVVASHGRDHLAFLFFTLQGTALPSSDARQWLKTLPITSAFDQEKKASQTDFTTNKNLDSVIGVFLTSTGFARLGIPEYLIPGDVAFRKGARASAASLGHFNVGSWDSWASSQTAGLIQLANDDAAVLEALIEKFLTEISNLSPAIKVVSILRGTANRNGTLGREPFGFADGIAQPLFLKRHIDRFLESNAGTDWDPSANPMHLVLVPEFGQEQAFGSYLVIQKIKQNTDAFERAARAVSSATGDGLETAEAYLMGRHKDGTPLVHSAEAKNTPIDSFSFSGDESGMKCPYASHIRRMNPRHSDNDSLGRRITRRGFVYKEGEDVGLMFACFQQDISRQFHFLQRVWANLHPTDPIPDPIIGNSFNHKFPVGWGNLTGELASVSLPRLTEVRGSAYLYAPSLKFFQSL